MGTLIAKIFVKCPDLDIEVSLHKKCLNCQYYNRWGVQGHKAYVSCDKAKEKREDK